MCRCPRLLIIAIGLQLVLSSTTSAQIVSRWRERKNAAKEQQESPRIHQPLVSPAARPAADGEGDDVRPAAATDQNRLRPTPLSVTPPPSPPVVSRPIAKVAVNAPAPEQVNVITVIPQIAIETTGPAEVNVGRRAKYTITVRNDGTTPAQGLILNAMLPAGVELVSSDPQPDVMQDQLEYRLGTITAKAAVKVQIDLIPRERGAMNLKTHASMSTAATAAVQVKSPEVSVRLTGPSEAIMGEVVKFKATIANTGDGIAENLSVAHQLLDSLGAGANSESRSAPGTSRIERLLPGQSEEIDLPVAASVVGLMRASVSVRGDNGLDAQASAEVQVRRPTIEIRTVGPESRLVQRSGGYVILVSNTGDAAAQSVVITATIPKGLEVVGIEKRTTFDKNMNTLTWNLAQLAAGSTELLKFQLKAIEEGGQTILVEVSGQRNISAQATHLVQVMGKADLTLTVEDIPGPIEVGGPVTYQIRVKNGGSKPAHHIRIRCLMPTGLDVQPSADFSVNGTTVDFNAIERLAAGEERVIRLGTTGRESGDQVIRFTLDCDILPRELTAETTTFFFKSKK